MLTFQVGENPTADAVIQYGRDNSFNLVSSINL